LAVPYLEVTGLNHFSSQGDIRAEVAETNEEKYAMWIMLLVLVSFTVGTLLSLLRVIWEPK
jgi:hypothetical protein